MFLVILYIRLRKDQLPKSKTTVIIIIGSLKKEVDEDGG